MKKSFSLLPPLQWCSILAAALAALLQTAAIFFGSEPSSNYFSKDALLPTLAFALALLSAILGSIAAWTTKAPSEPNLIFSKRASVFCPAVGFLAPAITLFNFREKRAALLCIPFLFLAAFYSVLVNLPEQRKRRGSTALVGFASVIACALLNTYLYFDMTVEMNAPAKVALQAGLLCAMLMLLGELRFLVGTPQPHVFMMMCSWTLGTCSLCAVPLPLAYLAGIHKRADYCAIAILTLFLWITALIYLLRCYQKRKPAQNTQNESSDSERRSQ